MFRSRGWDEGYVMERVAAEVGCGQPGLVPVGTSAIQLGGSLS